MMVWTTNNRVKKKTAIAVTIATLAAILLLGFALLAPWGTSTANSATAAPGSFTGVASCAGSTCHGRMVPDGKVVRQDELARWQEPSTPGGAHSRAFNVLSNQRSQQIAATLGLGAATSAKECLGCHATPAGGNARGARFLTNDGVVCEACHGAAGGWIASHYAVDASHADNVANGLIPLEKPVARAFACLDCHFGSADQGQFVTHRLMAAGHPRISFELDLFSAMQAHHDEDADYIERKGATDSVRMWAVGQAMALERSLSLYASNRGTEGAFPEFYFFDCHSCHRRIYDQDARVKTWEANPGRPIPAGMPPYNDENMIMLIAAAKVAAPGMASRLEADSRAFHGALAKDRSSAVAAAGKLRQTAADLAAALSNVRTSGTMAFAIIDQIESKFVLARLTDYEGSVQAVMAVDTLLNALVKSGRITVGAAAGIRAHVNRAYAAVNDPNNYKPAQFRVALGHATRSMGALR